MRRPVSGHSFAVLAAIALLSFLAFNFLDKKKSAVRRDAEDADTGTSDLSTETTETVSVPSSSSVANSSASSSSTAPASSPLTFPFENCYHVFLSFRGSDVRESFIDHLYSELVNAGICAFRDDDALCQEGQIDRDSLGALKNSKIMIPIISINYGLSKWCLDELVRIMECKNDNSGHVALPIFYKVERTHVQHQIGSFGDSFHNLQTCFDRTIVEKWEQALAEVSSLEGWEIKGNEVELAKSIVQDLRSNLKKEFELVISEDLVEIDGHGKKVMEFADENSDATPFDNRIRGIDLDREIVYEETQEVLQYHSNLWDSKEGLKVPKENEGTDQGTDQIKAISLSKDSLECSCKLVDHGDAYSFEFDHSTSLTFLYVSGAQLCGDFKNSFEESRWREWWNCCLNNFNIKELIALDLSRSTILDDWHGWSVIKMAEKLRFLDLQSCESLRSMVFPSAFKNLEVLILKDCWRLEQIDSSIGGMKLKYLDLTSCESLRSTGFLSAFKKLEVLILRDCEEVEQIDSSIGDMECLVHLDLTGCKSLEVLPAEMSKLKALRRLLLKKIPNISVVPEVGALQNLEILKICRTGIKNLPNGIGRLSKLRDLDVSCCKQLREEMPESLSNLSSLQSLDFYGCEELQSLPDLPFSLTYLSITCQSRRLPSLSHLTHLKELRLHDCRFLECFQPTDVEKSGLAKSVNTPFKLEILKIWGCKFMNILDVSQLNHLRILLVKHCNDKLEVRGIDKLKYLEILNLDIPNTEGGASI